MYTRGKQNTIINVVVTATKLLENTIAIEPFRQSDEYNFDFIRMIRFISNGQSNFAVNSCR